MILDSKIPTQKEVDKIQKDLLDLQPVYWNGSAYKFKAVIEIRSLSTAESWSFPAFVKSFSDSYESKWNAEDVFGRIDPIYTYKNTYRKINMQITIPAWDVDDAFWNWVNINELTQSLYPGYKEINGEQIISTPPIFGMKFHNLIREMNTGKYLQDYVYGVFESGLSIEPNVDEGFLFDSNVYRVNWNNKDKAEQNRKLSENYGDGRDGGLLILPKSYTLNLPFSVIHSFFRGNKNNRINSMGGPSVSAKADQTIESLGPDEITRTKSDANVSNERRQFLKDVEDKKRNKMMGK